MLANGSVLDTNVIIKVLNNDPEAVKLKGKVAKSYTALPVATFDKHFEYIEDIELAK